MTTTVHIPADYVGRIGDLVGVSLLTNLNERRTA